MSGSPSIADWSRATAEPAGAAHVGAAGSGWMSQESTMSPRKAGVGEIPRSATRQASSFVPAVVEPPQSWSTPSKVAERPPPPVKKLLPPAKSYVRLPGMPSSSPRLNVNWAPTLALPTPGTGSPAAGSLSAIAAPRFTFTGPMPALRLIGSTAARPSSSRLVVSTIVGTGIPSFSGMPISSVAFAL